ncbi:MAG: NAD-dependent epimerase/dehydratase family protein [Ignavibacteria bacterium]|nr:NAD-dependent epimerase/dehydratase family protein [Ignavibacteria bacterium]
MKIQGLKILVTGGAGFIGSHIVESLVFNGAKVKVLDNLSSGSFDNLQEIADDIEFIEGDIRNIDLIYKITRGIDVVSHHAAQLEISLSTSDPFLDLEINTVATLNLLNACVKNNVPKFIFASSACVYGHKDTLTSENSPRNPNWAYGISKLAAEEYCRLYSELYAISTISLRYSIIYGEKEWYRRSIPIFLKRVIERKPPVIFAGGKTIRDFLYVKDLVELHNIVVTKSDLKSTVYNVSSGIPRTISEVAHYISRTFFDGSVVNEELEEGGFSQYIEGKQRNPNDLKMMWLDNKKAQDELNWKPKISFEEGIEKEYLWAKKNLHRWNEILKVNHKK